MEEGSEEIWDWHKKKESRAKEIKRSLEDQENLILEQEQIRKNLELRRKQQENEQLKLYLDQQQRDIEQEKIRA